MVFTNPIKSINCIIRVIVIFSLSVLFSACYSYHPYIDKSHPDLAEKNLRHSAFVINQKEFPREYGILKKSKLYSFTSDSTTPLKVKLNKMELPFFIGCVTTQVVGLAFTLGQIPVKLPKEYTFHLEEIENNTTTIIAYKLDVDKRIWFWDMFSWKKSLNNALALSLQKREQQSTLAQDQ